MGNQVVQSHPEAGARPDRPGTSLRGLSKTFGATTALNDVSLDIRQGTAHALVGENGSGKSTLVKILAGVVTADAGTIEVDGRSFDATSHTPAEARAAGFRFVHQQNSTFPELSVAENLAIGRGFETGFGGRIKWGAVRERTVEVLERFGIDARPDTRVRDLGPATQMMLAIARALQDQARADEGVLVLDEPTASLPREEVDFLLASLQRYVTAGQTVVYVTHRLEEVVAFADQATVLRDGRLVETLPREAINHEKLVTLMVGRELATADRAAAAAKGPGRDGATPVLEAIGLNHGRIDLELHGGEVVGVAGLLGSGRSALLRSLFGADATTGVEVRVDGTPVTLRDPSDARRAGIAYVPENRAASLFADLTINENMSIAALDRYSSWGRMSAKAERAGTAEAMDRFLVRGAPPSSPVSALSGGNQQKVMLARWLQQEPRVLLLDEPTQGVDVGARAEIHSLVRGAVDGGATALVVSSDLEELTAISDRILVLRDGTVAGVLAGAEIDESSLDSMVYAREQAA